MRKNLQVYFLTMASLISLSCQFAYSFIPALDTSRKACAEFDLTPEECANIGTHKYSSSEEILFDNTGETCYPSDDDIVLTIKFINQDTLIYIPPVGYEIEFKRISDNHFEGQFTQPDGKYRWEDSITFNNSGLVIEASSFLVEGNVHLCTFLVEHKFLSSEQQS
jgi:hypothetical protein